MCNNYSMKNSERGYVKLLVIFLIVLAIALGVYSYTRENNGNSVIQSETEEIQQVSADTYDDWRAYTNAFYGFSFMYPKEWTQLIDVPVNEKEQDKAVSVTITPNGPALVYVWSYARSDSQDFHAKVSQFKESCSESQIFIGSLPATRYDCKPEIVNPGGDLNPTPLKMSSIAFNIKNYKPILIMYDRAVTYLEADNVFEKMVRSFNFTKGADTFNQNWRTYFDPDGDFLFQYPTMMVGADLTLDVFSTKTKENIDANGCYTSLTPNPNVYSKVIINNVSYCLSTSTDVGAGQLYNYYYYTMLRGDTHITIGYRVHTSNGCGALVDSPGYDSCINFNYDAQVLKPIQRSIASLRLIN
jgi:hypothetical protein